MEKNVKKKMPAEKAKKMVELYRDFCGRHPEGKLTKSVWFSLEKLKGIINEIDNDTTAADHPGVRFYFGTYAEKEVVGTINGSVEYIYRNTLIMVPTKQAIEKGKKINEDYNVEKFIEPVNQGELCPEECGGTDRWGMPNRK